MAPNDVFVLLLRTCDCYLTSQKGIKDAGTIKAASQLTEMGRGSPSNQRGRTPQPSSGASFCHHSTEARTGRGTVAAAGNTPAFPPSREGTEVVQSVCETICQYQPWTFKTPGLWSLLFLPMIRCITLTKIPNKHAAPQCPARLCDITESLSLLQMSEARWLDLRAGEGGW